MYNILKTNHDIMSLSKRIGQRVPLCAKLESIEKNHISFNCGLGVLTYLSKKESSAVELKSKKIFLLCTDSELPYSNQLVDINKYNRSIFKQRFNNHIKFNLWKVLSYYYVYNKPIYGLPLNLDKLNLTIGVSGMSLSVLTGTKVYNENYDNKKYRY